MNTSVSINQTVAVVITNATDLPHAVDLLLHEYGFDMLFMALATIGASHRAPRAMWLALRLAECDGVRHRAA